MSDTFDRDRSDAPVWVHSDLDDAGLSPFAYRIYGHIARRTNKGKAWPGSKSMAKVCRISEPTVRKAISELESRGMLKVKRSKGGRESNHYFLTARAMWAPLKEIDPSMTLTPGVNDVDPTPKGRCHKDTTVRNSKKDTPLPPNGGEISCEEEGYLFELPEPLPNEPDDTADIAAIYDAYPRKENRAAALKAIRACLKRNAQKLKLDAPALLASTQAYASMVKAAGTELKFIPHPATWFNQDRWQDNTAKDDTLPDKW